MAASSSHVRIYRILGCLAVLPSGLVLAIYLGAGEAFDISPFRGSGLVLTVSLILWLLVLTLHPGRSIRRFLIFAIIPTALFALGTPWYGLSIRYYVDQWSAAYKLEELLRSNPRMILYSVDAE